MSVRVPDKKIIAVIIAYNAERTIRQTYDDIPKDWVDEILIGDDCSQDETFKVASTLQGVKAIRHAKNQHMGGNQTILYDRALEMGADIVVLLHGDNQFDPHKLPDMVRPIVAGEADAVLGSRILGQLTKEGGMPLWKFFGNNLLNFIQNCAFRLQLTDYATGYKAYSRKVLETIPYHRNRRDFIFDEEFNAQIVHFGFRLAQVPIPTKYFDEASTVNFRQSVHYGIFTVWTVLKYRLFLWGLMKPAFLLPKDGQAAAPR
ncbi:MAG: glycosyltransferase family 2 protein [Kiritimatiellae bacterium]|nr:glycosyltransferase family 2 protein [Kiritimatiellia bacterium]